MIWTLIIAGFAMALVIEGLAYALAPSLLVRLLEFLRALPQDQIRWIGLATCVTGAVLLYWVFGVMGAI